jgi:hypothetical protein
MNHRMTVFLLTLLPAALVVSAAPALAAPARMKGQTTFTVRIENVSTTGTLRLSSGGTAPAPNSPGVWVVQDKPARLFEPGKVQPGWGLEMQAEDGNPATLAEHCTHHEGVVSSGVFNTPKGDDKPGPAFPGKAYEFTVMAKPGDRLAFTSMFGQSNDVFFSTDEKGIALFANGRPVSGDMTSQVYLWDAGTEVNEEPGIGPNQAPRQSAPNTGPSESKPVQRVHDGYAWPKVSDVIRVTIAPALSAAN